MRFFRDTYVQSEKIGEIVPKEYYLELFNKTTLQDKDFNRDNFIPGTGGQSKLYKQLIDETR